MEQSKVSTSYVVFKDSEKYRKILKRGYGHVFVVNLNSDGNHIVIDPKLHALHIKVYKFDVINYYKERGYSIVKIYYYPSKKRFFKFFGIFTCVNFVKYTLNLNCKSLTPYGLYKYLLKPKFKQRNSKILMAEVIQ